MDREADAPLVVVLHGAGGSGARCLMDNGWIAEADRRGFIVAAPDGLPVLPDSPAEPLANPTLWNEGRLRGAGGRAAIDDVAFVDAMLDRLHDELPIDRRRTFLVGVSNGGSMAFRLAAEASERFAALVVVASVPWTDGIPERPMPTLVVIGTEDPLVPLRGGIVRSQWFKEVRPPVHPALTLWARGLGLSPPVVKTVVDDANVSVQEWSQAPESSRAGTRTPAPMRVVYVKGYGHGWPGGLGSGLPRGDGGPTAHAVDATQLTGEFFAGAPTR
jgi:polyhydroxybutyrate depolymerase